LGVFTIAHPLSVNGLAGKVCTTGGGVGRRNVPVAVEILLAALPALSL
jgi:hypothetical protein